MGTTDNFDSGAFAGPLVASDTFPIISNASGRAATARGDMIAQISGRTRLCVLSGNLGTLSSLGTSAVATANATYVSSLIIPFPMLVKGIGFLNGATAATDKLIYGLYAAAGGAPLANTTVASSGTLAANANVFQEIDLTATYQVLKPGLYWIGWQCNGTTTTRRSIAAATWIETMTLAAGTAGSAGVMATITVPTTFTADTGPIGYVYS